MIKKSLSVYQKPLELKRLCCTEEKTVLHGSLKDLSFKYKSDSDLVRQSQSLRTFKLQIPHQTTPNCNYSINSIQQTKSESNIFISILFFKF